MTFDVNNGIMFHDQWYDVEYCKDRVEEICKILMQAKVERGDTVGLALTRTPDLLLAIMALLKLRITFIPLDIMFPQERIEFIVQDSEIKLLLVNHEHVFSYLNIEKLKINHKISEKEWIWPVTENDDSAEEEIAYVMYTSGTTGKPKGVEVLRKGLINLIQSLPLIIGLKKENTILCVTKEIFDIFFVESILALQIGLKVILCDNDEMLNPNLIKTLIIKHNIDVLQFTPSRLQLLKLYDSNFEFLKNIKILMLGGEAFPCTVLPELKIFKQLKIYNMYGPTETTVWSSISDLTEKEQADIGEPIAHTEIYLLDDELHEKKDGEYGEICIGGDGVAQGYRNRKELTKKSFIQWNGKKIYRTGDIGIRKNGLLYCCGRIDNQVKYHGFRIELEDVESHILQVDNVKLAVATLCKNKVQNDILVAFYIADQEISYEKFYRQMGVSLPEYMIPACFIRVPKFLFNESGKVDRKRIMEMYYKNKEGINLIDEDPIYKGLYEILDDNLEIDSELKINPETTFYSLGIDSLTYIKVIVAVEERFHIKFEDKYLDVNAFENVEKMVLYIKCNMTNNTETNSIIDSI